MVGKETAVHPKDGPRLFVAKQFISMPESRAHLLDLTDVPFFVPDDNQGKVGIGSKVEPPGIDPNRYSSHPIEFVLDPYGTPRMSG